MTARFVFTEEAETQLLEIPPCAAPPERDDVFDLQAVAFEDADHW